MVSPSYMEIPCSAPKTRRTFTYSARHFRPTALDRLAFCGISSLTMTPFLHFFHPTRLPSGVIDSSAVIRSAFFAPERFAPERFAPERSAPYRFAQERFAPYRFAPYRYARDRSGRERSARERSAPDRFAPERSAPYRFAPERFAPKMFAPERFAPERFARELTAASTASFHESVSMANKTAPPQRDLTSNFMPSAFRFRSDRTSQDPA